jgi:two-component system, OmpR family, sensor kinase
MHPDASTPAPTRWRRVRLSIRARLTLWYSVVVLMVLLASGAAVSWLQTELGLRRVDGSLAAAADTVVGVVRNELDEGLTFEQSVRDMLGELDLSGVGFAVLNASRQVVGAKASGKTRPRDDHIASAMAPTTIEIDGAGEARLRGAGASHRGRTFSVVVWTSMQPLHDERRTLQLAMLLGIPLAVVLAVLGGLSIGRRSLQPLADMAAQAEATGVQASDARLIPPNPDDELGTLARAFNGLLDRLARSLRAQRAFMADASHQLRTPVSIARTAAQVTLSRDDRTQAEYRESLEVIAKQTQRLTKMVDDMFMLARADAEARPLQIAPLYLDEIVDEAVDESRLLATARKVRLQTESPGETPFVGDQHLLCQLFMNLLDNAIRVTPEGGSIVIALRRDVHGVSVTVSDTGPGIAEGRREHIFERFVRLDAAGAEGGGGGLGLPIARWIAEAHGGTLTVESSGLHGSRFLVTLPTADPDATNGSPRTASATSGPKRSSLSEQRP